ncbi:MAG: LPS assembly lipoprotein LptE [Flavobacteriales bacterium]
MIKKISVFLVLILFATSCKFYSISGVNVNPKLKEFTIRPIANQAGTVNPTLALDLREALANRINRQTSLVENPKGDELVYELMIEQYNVIPVGVNSNAEAGENRFQIKIKCVFTNSLEPDQNFEKSFPRFENFASAVSFQSVEDELVENLIDQLVDDVFNESLANW